ncbi:YcxB family protein [Jiella mangrovi]|uniref:YcxB family protein n=1 Tax=Jiella mangrovi TaxID=2821407 RepID=A0ABS4BH57_9HYPH|nr:YcxB family protein [Jiella mangrovi]MBP0615516.1 YcxB family protein [Jiella mangrovi]
MKERGLLMFSGIGILAAVVVSSLSEPQFDVVSMLLVPFVIWALMALIARLFFWSAIGRLMKRLRRRRIAGVEPFDFCMSADGIVLEVPDAEGKKTVSSQFPWSSIMAVDRDDERYIFWWGRRRAVVFPREAFLSEDEERSFRERLAAWWKREPTSPPSFRKRTKSRSAASGERH